jgi:hypothetical protein
MMSLLGSNDEIIDSQVDGDTAVVNVSITSIDLSAVMTTYIANAFSLAYSNLDATEDELTVLMMQAFGDAIEAKLGTTVTNEAAVNLEKVDGEWKIVGMKHLSMRFTEDCFPQWKRSKIVFADP